MEFEDTRKSIAESEILKSKTAEREVNLTIEPISCHAHVLTCLNPEVPQSGSCGILLIDGKGMQLLPKEPHCRMWKPTPAIRVSWGNVRELRQNILKKGKFSANFGVTVSEDTILVDNRLDAVLRIQIKENDKRQAITDVFSKLPAFTSAKKCPKCGGVADQIKCQDCGIILAQYHRSKGLKLMPVGALMIVIEIILILFFPTRWSILVGLEATIIFLGSIIFLFGLAKLITGRRLLLK